MKLFITLNLFLFICYSSISQTDCILSKFEFNKEVKVLKTVCKCDTGLVLVLEQLRWGKWTVIDTTICGSEIAITPIIGENKYKVLLLDQPFVSMSLTFQWREKDEVYYVKNNHLYLLKNGPIKLFDTSGNEVASWDENPVSLDSVKPGLYYLHFVSQNETYDLFIRQGSK